MLKKSIISTVGCVAGLTLMLVACGETKTGATIPEGFIKVTEDRKQIGVVQTIKHKDTGCYYVIAGSGPSGVSVEQMFVDKNGVSVPYCDSKQ